MRLIRKFSLCLLVLLLVVSIAQAQIDLPDPTLSICWTEYTGGGTMGVRVHPDGYGSRFDQARVISEGVVDATIHVRLLNGWGTPFTNFPREDMWLESLDPHFVLCPGGSIADTSTDQNGESTWVLPLRGGGFSEDLTQVYVMGWALASTSGLNVHFNSPDINGDLDVDLSDVVLLAEDLYGGVYRFRSDLWYDSYINLSDIATFVEGFGAECP